jgi:hypothetical protein
LEATNSTSGRTRPVSLQSWHMTDSVGSTSGWSFVSDGYVDQTCHLVLPDSQASDHIVDDPPRVVSRQPSDYGCFVDNIMCCCCWRGLETSFREPTNPVPRIICADIFDRFVHHLHDDLNNTCMFLRLDMSMYNECRGRSKSARQ